MTRLSRHIKANLKAARTKAGLSQEGLAQKSGVHSSTIARIEQGRTTQPRDEELAKIAEALGTTPDDLMGMGENRADDEMTLPPVVDQSPDRQRLLARYGDDDEFVDAVLERLIGESQERRLTVLGLLLGRIGDMLGRPPLPRELSGARQLSH